MAKYIFRLERMHVNFQRGKEPDVYSSTFGLEIGSRSFGPIGRFLNKKAPTQGNPGIQSGDNINFADFPPDNPVSKWGTWDIGPIEIGANDIVSVDYAFINTSDNGPSISQGDQTKIAFTTFTSIVGIGLATLKGIEGIASVTTGVGAVLAELVGDLIPGTPKCNGTAFADKVLLSGAQLAADTTNLSGRTMVTRTVGNPDTPSDCGHAPSADITFSVSALRFESIQRFLGSKGDLRQGIKKALHLTPPIGLRSLIEEH